MFVADMTNNLRFAFDFAQSVQSNLGLNPNKCWFVNVVNDQINFDSLPASTTPVLTRITLADGYRFWTSGGDDDGYLNPQVNQLSSEQVVLSGGSLTDNMVILGPLVYPYVSPYGHTFGTDPNLFQKVDDSFSNNQLFIKIIGPTFPPQGSYFEVKRIIIGDMENVDYSVLLKSTSSQPLT